AIPSTCRSRSGDSADQRSTCSSTQSFTRQTFQPLKVSCQIFRRRNTVTVMTHLAATEVITAAIQLMRAGHWNTALNLLRACHTDDPDEQRALALAIAEVAVDQDFAQQTDNGSAALAAVVPLLDGAPGMTWDVAMLKLRNDYATALFQSTDKAAVLEERALRLIEQAPDDARRGAVSFYAGVMADNLLSKPEQAFAHYTTALELGEKTGDELLASLALRHLG